MTESAQNDEARQRLADRVLEAFELALDQDDVISAGLLGQVLEVSMTRNAGGKFFTERREFQEEADIAFNRLRALKKKVAGE